MLRINAGKISDGGDDITAREEEDVERKTRGETLRRQRSQVNSNHNNHYNKHNVHYLFFSITTNY